MSERQSQLIHECVARMKFAGIADCSHAILGVLTVSR